MKRISKPKLVAIAIFALIIAVLFIINSCKKDFHSNVSTINPNGLVIDTSVITQVKHWYQTAYPETGSSKMITQNNNISPGNNLNQVLTPYWSKAQAFIKDSLIIIEIPALKKGDFAFSTHRTAANSFDFTKSPSITSLLIVINKGHIGAYSMTIMGDSSYINGNYNKLKNNTYRKKEKDFTGYVFYNQLNGNFVNGWRYSNGKVVGAISRQQSKPTNNTEGVAIQNSNIRTDVEEPPNNGCSEIVVEYWELCSYWENDVYYENPISCTYYTTTTIYSIPCDDDGGGGGDGDITPPPIVLCQPPTVSEESVNGRLKINVEEPPPGGGSGNNNGTTTVTTQQQCPDTTAQDPCKIAAALNKIAATQQEISEDKQILQLSSQFEYYASKNLTSLTGTSYTYTPPATENLVDQGDPVFTWDSTNGYTVGCTHGHPNNSPPSYADVFNLVQDLNNPLLTAAGATSIGVFEANASNTITTASGNYVITVNNWNTLQADYNTYITNPSAYGTNFQLASSNYATANPDATLIDDGEYALLSSFGSAINVYYAAPGSTNFVPLVINSDGNPSYVTCPN